MTQLFRLWERAAPATGRRRGRHSQGAGPRSIPRRPSRAAPRSAGRTRSENTRPVEKNTTVLCYIICTHLKGLIIVKENVERPPRAQYCSDRAQTSTTVSRRPSSVQTFSFCSNSARTKRHDRKQTKKT